MSKRDEINKWLNKELSEEHLIIDSVLDIFDKHQVSCWREISKSIRNKTQHFLNIYFGK